MLPTYHLNGSVVLFSYLTLCCDLNLRCEFFLVNILLIHSFAAKLVLGGINKNRHLPSPKEQTGGYLFLPESSKVSQSNSCLYKIPDLLFQGKNRNINYNKKIE